MKLQFIGCGDAFGTGGRFNTCFRVQHSGGSFLIDCGATSMVALRQANVAPNDIDSIFITHLHGDHFGGLPFFILDAQLYSGRTKPLRIAGPYGLVERLAQTQEALFPGSSLAVRKFELEIVEIAPDEKRVLWGVLVSAYPMRHPCGAPPLGLRLEVDGKAIAFTGDTEWNESIIALGKEADLLILECLYFNKKVPHHLNYVAIADNAAQIGARRMILTHFGPEMLENLANSAFEVAHDGLVLQL